MDFALDNSTLSLIEKSTGLNVSQLSEMPMRDVEQVRSKDSYYQVKKPREIPSRGSVYLFLHRILGLAKVERYLSRI